MAHTGRDQLESLLEAGRFGGLTIHGIDDLSGMNKR